MTTIEWTEATWNPIVGCSIVSPGCTNCYAMKMAARLEAMAKAKLDASKPGDEIALAHYLGTTKASKAGPVWTGHLAIASDRTLTEPLRRRKPTTYFVNSMGDLFHEDCPDEWIAAVFGIMAAAPQHTFQVLTKRSWKLRSWFAWHAATAKRREWIWEPWRVCEDAAVELVPDLPAIGCETAWPLPNVWLGVSAERQTEADARIPDLLATPAAVRFVSAEPLLGPIDFCNLPSVSGIGRYLDTLSTAGATDSDLPHRLDWIIVGGESGPGAQPMRPDWARSIRDQCAAAGVPFFFKQWGTHAWAPDDIVYTDAPAWGRAQGFTAGTRFEHPSCGRTSFEVGKGRAGRLLDGREWNEMPGASKYDQAPTDPRHGGKISE